MSSSMLSAEIQKLIRGLCLTDFPSGNGTWRKTKDSEERAETESIDALLDLLSCPHSPWQRDVSWSPQALALRQLAVLTPECLSTPFIYNYFTTLHIVDRGVSVIDDGLLKFSKLEELVLSANKISEIPTANLPSTLKILELRANWLSSLNSLASCPPPSNLQYLSLSSNSLGSHEDISYFTGRHWPQLVCLDLSDCEFQDQPALLSALNTLPCLRTLVLQGNPFTLAPSYPGLTVDSLPQLSYLDASWISPEERRCFRGLAKMSDLVVHMASATVSVGRMRGIPDPMTVLGPEFPVVSYSYFITYELLSHQTPANLKLDIETKSDTASTAQVTEDSSSDVDQQLNKICQSKKSKLAAGASIVNTRESCCDAAQVSRHSTSKQPWSECIDFGDTQTHIVCSLGVLKKFFNQGLHLRLEEEKVLSWPVAPEDFLVTKPSQTLKEKKGRKEKDPPVKSASTKDKSKDKKKKSAQELVQDAPITQILGSVHVPLQSLVKGGQRVKVLCDFGILHIDSAVETTQTLQKDLRKKNKEDKKKEDKETKCRGGNSPEVQNTASSKDKGKGRKEQEMEDSTSGQLEPVTVELSVELEKWQSASEAHQYLSLHQTS